ncbi:MAG: ribosome maturation factor RimM [Nitrospira sp.]|nr:ribosome maturation factor RimM [Nitrospira sp.]
MAAGEMVAVGKLVKPFGVRGRGRVLPLTDVPDRLENLKDVTLELPTGKTLVTTVTDVRTDGRSYLLGFSTFSTPEEVRAYNGAWLKIPEEHVPPAPEGHYYQFELIGLTVRDESGNSLGTLEEVVELPHHHLFVIRGDDREYLLPALRKWISCVDVAAGVMTVASPAEWGGDDAV